MVPLTTIFTPPSGCCNRFAVSIDSNTYHSSTGLISSGWWDRSFSKCVPSQYTKSLPTFSPGVCPEPMSIATTASPGVFGGSAWTGWCCQSGFSIWEPEFMVPFYCTSTITTPFSVLLDPNISTTDIYTVFSTHTWAMHDIITVEWQETDLKVLPEEIATRYASIMGITFTPTAGVCTTTMTATSTSSSSASEKSSSAVGTAPSTTASAYIQTSPTTLTIEIPSSMETSDYTTLPSLSSLSSLSSSPSLSSSSLSTTPNGGSRLSQQVDTLLIAWLAFLPWIFS